MKIILTNYYLLYLLLFIIFISFVKSSNIAESGYNKYLSKNITDSLKGFSVLVVIFSHIALFSVNKNIFVTIFKNSGFLAVALFLFVSGYGLTEQLNKRENYLKGFIFNKIIRLYLIFFISNIIVTILNNIFLKTNYSAKNILSSSLYMNFANGRELWFVAAILFLYLTFYLSFKLFKDKFSNISICIAPIFYIILCKLLDRGTWWYNTCFCFTIGVLVSIYKEKVFHFFKSKYLLNFAISLIGLVGLMFFYIRGHSAFQYIIPIVFIWFICILTLKIEPKSKSMQYINKISFEMYLVHLIILQIAFKDEIQRRSLYLIATIPIMIILSIITKWICDNIFKYSSKTIDLFKAKRLD